jgi:hypothetical protein
MIGTQSKIDLKSSQLHRKIYQRQFLLKGELQQFLTTLEIATLRTEEKEVVCYRIYWYGYSI